MATVAQLAARSYEDVAFVLFIAGYRVAFTDRHEITGSGPDSWIGEDDGDRVVALGLEPRTVRMGIGLLDTGMLIDDDVSFTIRDQDNHLIGFAEDEEGVALSERLAPTDDPAPSTLIDAFGGTASIHGRYVNGEAIGPSGERNLYQVLPGSPLPGQDHAAIDSPDGDVGLRPSVVRGSARWLEGRRVALYLIRRDPQSGAWAPWAEQVASGYSLLWWGTLRNATAQGTAWTLECEGPSSWLRRTLNVNRPADWIPIQVPLTFGTGEDKIAVALSYANQLGDERETCASSLYTTTLTPDQTPDQLAAEIDGLLQSLVGAAGPDQVFNLFENGAVKFTADKFTISCNNNTSSSNGFSLGAVCQIRMHERAWMHMGWDLRSQGQPLNTTLQSEYELEFAPGSAFYPPEADAVNDPTPSGYLEATFSTLPVDVAWAGEKWRCDGDGAERVFRALTPAQISTLWGDGNQAVTVGVGLDALYLEGQLAKPPAGVTLAGVTVNGGACNAAGFFAIRGGYRTDIDEEPITAYQVVRASWVDDDERVATHTDQRALIWVESYLDPKPFGVQNKKLSGAWSGTKLEICPVALLGYNVDGPDAAHRVLLRLLLSTGTARWSGVGESATLDAGDNKHNLGGKGDDLEIADLGLAIPEDLVDAASFAVAAEDLPGGKGGPLNMTKLAAIGPFDSQQLVQDILYPRAWCFSLDGGRYGLFAKAAPLSLDDVQVAITQVDVAGDVDELPPSEQVDFKPFEPVDLITVRWGAHQLGGEAVERAESIRARDPRATQRCGNAKVEVDGRTLLADGSWLPRFAELWANRMATFYGQSHVLVKVKVKGSKARDLWPGTVVSYSSPWPATRSGSYGMTARVGRVVSIERDLQTLAATCEIVVDGRDPSRVRTFAPVAALVQASTVEGRHDVATRKLFCQADAFSRGGPASDVAAFREPSWSTTGGDAKVYVWQSADGVRWENTAEFLVEATNDTEHSITYKAGSLSGTAPAGIWERRFGLLTLAPADDQPAGSWALQVFGVVCDSDGLFGASDTPGYPWTE